MTSIRKAFTVFINNRDYDVYDIDGKEHNGLNDTPKTYWLYYADRLPEGLLPPTDSEQLIPYCRASIPRSVWEIKFKENVYSKIKWDDYSFSQSCRCEMWMNGKLIYVFNTRNIEFAMPKAQYLMVVLCEHVFNFFEPEKEQGRKIYWYGLPATISIKNTPGEIGIVPDYTNFPKENWWSELKRRKTPIDKEWAEMEPEDDNESMMNDYINWGDALSDEHIGWFRKDTDIHQ